MHMDMKRSLLLQVEDLYISLYVFVHKKNNILKILHSSYELASYLPVKFTNFLKSSLIFYIFYCLNKLFTFLTCAFLKKYKVL